MLYRWLYTFFFYLLLPAILLRLLLRSLRAPAYRQRWAERFGFFPPLDKGQTVLWLHAVSVGEVLAAFPLIKALLQQCPKTVLMITTTTPTGSERVRVAFAAEMAQQRICHVYAPYDVPTALARFLNRCRPRLVIVMETELWPNMIHQCARRNIPVVLANARLSEKSAKGYARFSSLTRSLLAELSHVAVQNAQDGNRFVQLGLPEKNLTVTGSIKFDLEISSIIQQQAAQHKKNWGGEGKRIIWLAASTHPGEDEIILDCFRHLHKLSPTLLLVLVPRHPERFNKVFQLCGDNHFSVQRLSEAPEVFPQTQILLGDTMGDLLMLYGVCDVAFVGGSLIPVGGHNLIEPAAWSKPIVSGKHLHNFTEIADLLCSREALLIADTAEALEQHVGALLADKNKRQAMGVRAQQLAEENRGALQRLLKLIDIHLT